MTLKARERISLPPSTCSPQAAANHTEKSVKCRLSVSLIRGRDVTVMSNLIGQGMEGRSHMPTMLKVNADKSVFPLR